MALACAFMILPSILLEGIRKPNVFTEIYASASIIVPILLGGVVVTLFYQLAVVAVTAYCKAISVGIVHQLMVLPQMLAYTLASAELPTSWHMGAFSFTLFHVVGAICIILGTMGYSMARLVRQYVEKHYDTNDGSVGYYCESNRRRNAYKICRVCC